MTFTASNGYAVYVRDGGRLIVSNGITTKTFPVDGADTLREFFQHERDEQLGRWRWPENPDYVVYPNGEYARVLREVDGTSEVFIRQDVENSVGFKPALAARAYFAAHPEPKPRPWRDAKEGEAWVITREGVQYPAIFQAGMFGDVGGRWAMEEITDARRIWPEERP